MFSIFKKGLIFGAGFIISAITVGYLAISLFVGFIYESDETEGYQWSSRTYDSQSFEGTTLEEKIELSSAIFIAKFEETDNGFVTAVVTDIIKTTPDAELKYSVGDIYPDASYYKEDNVRHGDGVVIFFAGSPGKQKMTFNYSNNRIGGLNNISVEQFISKTVGPNA